MTILPGVLVLCLFHITVEAQKPCCTPLQWQATVGLTYGQAFLDSNTVPSLVNLTAEYVFDWNKRTTAIWVTGTLLPNLLPLHSVNIWDRATGVQWSVDLNTHKCQHTKLKKGPIDKLCIPDDAMHVATTRLGPSKIVCDIFHYKWPLGEDIKPAATTAMVAREGCTPVRVAWVDGEADSGGFLVDARVYNMKEGISNTSLLSPPKYCTHSNSKASENGPFSSVAKLLNSLFRTTK